VVGARRSSLAAVVALALLGACGTTRAYAPDPGAYDRVPAAWDGALRAARLDFDRGDPASAFDLLAPLAEERPQVLPVRVFLQEVELALLTTTGRAGALEAEPARAQAALFARYRDALQAQATPEGYVLAARLAPEGEQALAMLEQARVLDERCVWAHYGRAWWLYTLRRFKEAREEVRAALRLDGGHLPTMRLHATMLAGAGDVEDSAHVLEEWLERTADDPLFASYDRADALLDLAAIEVLLDHPKDALEHLSELDPRAVRDPLRAEEVRAAAHEARGEVSRALAALDRARAIEPRALLPLVQQAMLLEKAGDREGERAVWQRLLELTESDRDSQDDASAIDFEAALFRLQAHTRLERLALAQP